MGARPLLLPEQRGPRSLLTLASTLVLGFSAGTWFGGHSYVQQAAGPPRRLLASELIQGEQPSQAAGAGAFPSVTRDLYERVRADPALLQDPATLTPFLAAPWLLPKGSEAMLPHHRRNGNLSELLGIQASPDPLGQSKGVITLLYFNHQQAAMAMNCIYSLVKFGGVTSYIVVVWDERSLEACTHLNFPCFNASSWLPASVSNTEAKYRDANFISIMWLRTEFSRHVLNLGYTIHVSDVDLAYAPYDVHRSLLAYIHEANATGAFPKEFPLNTGSYMMLPGPRGSALMDAWVAEGRRQRARGFSEQQVLGGFLKNRAYAWCERPSECLKEAQALLGEEGGTGGGGEGAGAGAASKALLRSFLDARMRLFGGFGAQVQPCGHPFLFWHATGVTGQGPKVKRLKSFGFWFVDEGRCEGEAGRPHLARCPLRLWDDPFVERDFLKCDRSRLGLQFFRLPEGLRGRDVLGPSPRLSHYHALA